MHRQPTLARQLGVLGWGAIIAVAWSWATVIYDVATGDLHFWWTLAVVVCTAIVAWCTWRDWQTVKRRRATIARIRRQQQL